MTIRGCDDKIVNVAENGRDFAEEKRTGGRKGLESSRESERRGLRRGQKNLKKVVDKKKAMW